MDLQLISSDRVRQLAEQAESAPLGPRSERLVALDTGPVALGAIHGDVGGTEQILRRATVRRNERQADADPDRQRKPVDDDRPGELGAELLDHRDRRRFRADVGDQHGELVTTEPGDDSSLWCRSGELIGDPDQDHVTGLVTETIVDLLETVEIQQQDNAANVVGVRRQETGEVIVERASIEQVGEPVVVGLVSPPQRLLGALVDQQCRHSEQWEHQQAELDRNDEDRREREQCAIGRDAEKEAATHHRSQAGLVVERQDDAGQQTVGGEHQCAGDDDSEPHRYDRRPASVIGARSPSSRSTSAPAASEVVIWAVLKTILVGDL